MSEISKSCSFFGHRNTDLTENEEQKLQELIENLILNEKVDRFLFGSRSNFDYICHKIVTDLRQKYPYIKRFAYTCRSETCTLESEREYWEEVYSHFEKRKVTLLGVEEEIERKSKWTSGKASYVERNYAMIDDSDFCIFYYDEAYLPKRRKNSWRDFTDYQPKSGTGLAYKYATRKLKDNKKIIVYNVCKKDN